MMDSLSGENSEYLPQSRGDLPKVKMEIPYQSSSYTPLLFLISPEVILKGFPTLEPKGLEPDVFWFQEDVLSKGEELIRAIFLLAAHWKSSPERIDILDSAIDSYKSERISLGKAVELTGLQYEDLIEEFIKRDVKLFFGPETWEKAEEESQIVREMLARRREEGTTS